MNDRDSTLSKEPMRHHFPLIAMLVLLIPTLGAQPVTALLPADPTPQFRLQGIGATIGPSLM
jgi:hypothetical protein